MNECIFRPLIVFIIAIISRYWLNKQYHQAWQGVEVDDRPQSPPKL